MPQIVCEGALCQCTGGAAPAALTVTSQFVLTIDGLPVATVADCVPMVNVMPFGTCTFLPTPAGPGPCVPKPTGTWLPGSLVKKVMGQPVLLDSCELMCGQGGVISITLPENLIEQSV